MPIYDYKCKDCNAAFDIFHKVREVDEDIICPNCSSHNYSRLISITNSIIKGISSTACSRENCGMEGSCGGNNCPLGQ
ncbi:MAG: zinc ribbon domain-containing protein [Bacteroidetes bacterium]|nr:zinc ribbon domain-containing protein [Bacteroidota bacterium]